MDNNKQKIQKEGGSPEKPVKGVGSKPNHGAPQRVVNIGSGERKSGTSESMATKPGTSGSTGSMPGSSGSRSTGTGTGYTKDKGGRKVPPSKQRYRNRRAALRLLGKLAGTPKGQLTEEQQKSVAWAKQTISCRSPERDLSSKRQRSQDEVEAGSSKRARVIGDATVTKPVERTRFSDVVKESVLVLAVIDKSQDDGSISAEKWKRVYYALNTTFLGILGENPGPPPSCRDAGWYQGRVKLTVCETGDPRTFLRKRSHGWAKYGRERDWPWWVGMKFPTDQEQGSGFRQSQLTRR